MEPEIEITYYTDPLCCWSWAFEPQWRRLRYEFSGKINWRYIMGGLLPDWSSYNDPLNSVSRPVQMGPVWMEAAHISGMPIRNKIWIDEAPASSYPACIAYKCAELQSTEAGELYLRCLREAVMLHGQNISKKEVLLNLAKEVSKENPGLFSEAAFNQHWDSQAGRDAFGLDLKNIRYNKIGRFPTLILKESGESNGIMVVGYRPYSALLDAIHVVASGITVSNQGQSPEDYKKFWGKITNREMKEVFPEFAVSEQQSF